MSYTSQDIRLFAYLIKSNDISMDVARHWCFEQYALDDIPTWIYDITIDSSKDEFLELLKVHYDVDGTIDFEFEVGSYCQWYKNDGFSLYALIQNLLVFIGKSEFSDEELMLLEKSEALFKENKNAVVEVLPMIQDFIDAYAVLYQNRLSHFKGNIGLKTLK